MIKNRSEVPIYEVDGKETIVGKGPTLVISSHWNRDSMVVLEIAGGQAAFTVTAADLRAAIANATNISRHS